MQNRKWILTSLVMTFSASPFWRSFWRRLLPCWVSDLLGIIEVCNIFITPTIYLLLNVFMLTLGAIIIFFSGRVWVR